MKLNNLKESPLVQGATEAKRPTRWWVAILFTVIVCILILGTAVSLLVGLVYDPPPNSIRWTSGHGKRAIVASFG